MAGELVRRQGKKLAEAAEYWLSGSASSQTEKLADDDNGFNVVIVTTGAVEDDEPDEFEVWPENVEAVKWFQRLQTQWRIGMNGALGMEYGVIFELFRMYEVAEPRALFEDLQIMEFAVLNKIAEDRS
jgi:hypothetical protein